MVDKELFQGNTVKRPHARKHGVTWENTPLPTRKSSEVKIPCCVVDREWLIHHSEYDKNIFMSALSVTLPDDPDPGAEADDEEEQEGRGDDALTGVLDPQLLQNEV
ncbi:hypothetical protein EWM64_g7264 [Hericium alpestre]|uniref:Uncharacterized protein n=1 Tax=Hericium alpestre TaxID=135208 RepID=A0A4Y9ZTD1_9AGAM|nr:hypothetical protein EWM64_g7264 [Hericium alpestre]